MRRLAGGSRAAKAAIAGEIRLEIDFLIAIVLERMQRTPQVLRPLVAIKLGHRPDDLRQHGMQSGRQLEQIAATGDESLVVPGIGEVQTAGQAGENQPQAEDVGERVVMPQSMLPADVAAQISGSLKLGGGLAGRLRLDLVDPRVELADDGGAVDDFDPLGLRLEQAADARQLVLGRTAILLSEADSPAFDLERTSPSSGAHPRLVQGDHLSDERQKRRQRVFGGEAAAFDALVEKFVKRRHG